MKAKTKRSESSLEPLWETEARAGPKLEARAKLLEAAATAFMEGGYAETTLDDVAAITGMTKGQIYHYYRSKIDLYFDVVVGAFFILNEAVRPIAEQEDLDPRTKLRRIAYKHTMVLTETFAFQKVALEAAQHRFHPGSSERQSRAMERMLQFRSEYEDLIVRVLKDGRAAGQFHIESVSVTAKAVLGTLNWLLVWYDPKRSPREEDRIPIAERHADFVIAAVSHHSKRIEGLESYGAASTSLRLLAEGALLKSADAPNG